MGASRHRVRSIKPELRHCGTEQYIDVNFQVCCARGDTSISLQESKHVFKFKTDNAFFTRWAVRPHAKSNRPLSIFLLR